MAANPGFFRRFFYAFVVFFRFILDAAFAGRVLQVWPDQPALAEAEPPAELPPARPEPAPAPPPPAPKAPDHAAALHLLSVLQREGRLVDFLQEDIAGFDDASVGAAVRVVHEGCRKALSDYFTLEPVFSQGEGERVTVEAGFERSAVRLTGNVTGEPPFSGELRHHGWIAAEVRLPPPPSGQDLRVIAPGEVEL